MSFDPYTAWLRIPENRRPPNHYELFGLPTLESDSERIRAAAMDRISLVRKYQIGQHAGDAIRLLGEMSRAFDCLTDAQRKLDYDRQLGSQQTVVAQPAQTVADAPVPPRPPQAPLVIAKVLEPNEAPQATTAKPVVLKTTASPSPLVQTTGASPPAGAKSSDSLAVRRRRRHQKHNQAVFIAAGVVVLVTIGALWLATRGDAPSVASTTAATNAPNAKPDGVDVSLPADGRPAKAAPAPQSSPATSTTIVPTTSGSEPAANTPTVGPTTTSPQPPVNPSAVVSVTTIQPQAAPIQPAVEPPTTGTAIDVLKLINVNRDALKGQWQRLGSGNVSAPNGVQCAALELPIDPPEQYVLTVHSIRPQASSPGTLVIGLVSQGSPFVVVVDGNGKVGLEMVDGRMFNANETTHAGGVYPGTSGTSAASTVFVCTVLKSRVKVTVDGKPIIDWQGDPRRLSLFNVWPVRNRRRLFVGAHSTHLIRKLELAPIEGSGGGNSAAAPVPIVTAPSPAPPQDDGKLAARAQQMIDSLMVDKVAPTPLLAESMLRLMHEAVEAEEFDVAARLAALVPPVADEVRDANQRRLLRIEISEAKKAQATCAALARAKQTLATTPDDGLANNLYGRHLCLTVGDWPRGLPHLAKSSDAKIAALAAADRAAPTDSKTQVDLADRWWDQALAAPIDQKPQFKARAGHWYIQAAPNLTGLAKAQVEKRISQIDVTPRMSVAAGGAGDLVNKFRSQIRMAASSQYSSSWSVERLIDGKQNTSWFTAVNDSASTGRSPWFTATFPSDITVTKVRVWGNREGSYAQQPYRVLTASAILLDSRGLLLRTMNATMQGAYGDLEFDFRVPTPGVRIVRFQSVTDQGSLNGSGEIALGELEVH